MKNPTNEKTVSLLSATKLSLTKETVKGLTIRTGVKAGRFAAGSISDGAGGSCPIA